MAHGLTARQAELVHHVRSFTKRHGYPPTIRELSALMGNASCNGTHEVLMRCVAKGFVERDTGVIRGLRLVTP